ncbi:MAG: lipocalin-like domain-containing protein [Burkholderiaceae bacterium]
MRLSRRAWLALLPAAAAAAPGADDDEPVRAGRVLRFPRDHGAHPRARIEWWYATGWLDGPEGPIGFQVTFFRSRTGLAEKLGSRFAPRQLLFAHAAISEIAARRHLQAQQAARWSGDPDAPAAVAATHDTGLRLGRWLMGRDGEPGGGRYRAQVGGGDAPFDLQLTLQATQPLLLQGDAGHSRKGPQPQQASHYYSLPQLAAQALLQLGGRRLELRGRAWLDHEWSDELMPADAVGWDWAGINLADGGALTAFRLRTREGAPLWAGGSHRSGDGRLRIFGPADVRFTALRHWASPATLARYPVAWRLETPAGEHQLQALLDAQELDGSASTGAVYWEGLSELRDDGGRAIGRGYLEMTGYARPLTL